MCKEVYRGEGIHVKMREVETYRKPSKTDTHTHTSTDTYPHTQSQSGTHFKDKLNEDFMAAGITSLSEKKKKKSLLFSFSFSRPHWCHLDSLRSVRVPDCARFVLWGIVLIVLCLTALIWAGMQPVTRDTPHHTQTHWKTSTVNTGTMCMGLPWVKRVKGVRATLWLG